MVLLEHCFSRIDSAYVRGGSNTYSGVGSNAEDERQSKGKATHD